MNENIMVKSTGINKFNKLDIVSSGKAYGTKFWASWKGKEFGGWAITLNTDGRTIQERRNVCNEINAELSKTCISVKLDMDSIEKKIIENYNEGVKS